MQDTIMILVEGNQTYPLCFKCNVFVSHKAINSRHIAISFCRRGEERKCHCLLEEEARSGTETVIIAYKIPTPQSPPSSTLG